MLIPKITVRRYGNCGETGGAEWFSGGKRRPAEGFPPKAVCILGTKKRGLVADPSEKSSHVKRTRGKGKFHK